MCVCVCECVCMVSESVLVSLLYIFPFVSYGTEGGRRQIKKKNCYDFSQSISFFFLEVL